MSDQHTKGRIVSEPFTDAANAMHQLRAADTVLFQDGILARFVSAENGRRLAACWNAFDSVSTEMIEATVGTGSMQLACDSMLKLPAAQSELAVIRALLREVMSAGGSSESFAVDDKIRSYLDASDKQGGGHV